MHAFRALLVLLFINILVFTILAIANQGPDLLTPFISDVASLTWPGQFNVDFSSYLILSALWVAWRNRFTPAGIGLALMAQVLGILFFAPYLLYLTFSAKGNIKEVLVGK